MNLQSHVSPEGLADVFRTSNPPVMFHHLLEDLEHLEDALSVIEQGIKVF